MDENHWKEYFAEQNFAIYPQYIKKSGKNNKPVLDEKVMSLACEAQECKLGSCHMMTWGTNPETKEGLEMHNRIVPKLDYETAVRLARKCTINSIIFKDENGCREICINEEGEKVVRTFDIKDANGETDLNVMREIFAHMMGAGAEESLKKTLAETIRVYYVTPPKPSMFRGTYGNVRAF